MYKSVDSNSELRSARMAPWHQAGTPGMAQVVGIQHLSLLAGLGCAFGFLEGRGVGGMLGMKNNYWAVRRRYTSQDCRSGLRMT